jgi:hypothetical protein
MRLKNTTGVNVVLGKDISVLLCFQRLKSGRLVRNRGQTGRFLTVQHAPLPFNPQFRPFTAKRLTTSVRCAMLSLFVEAYPRRPLDCFYSPGPIRCPLPSKSFPLYLFADPHPLTSVPSILYKNNRGGGYSCFKSAHYLVTSLPPCFLFSKSFSRNTYGSPRKCCKQKTCTSANLFRCNTYIKYGVGASPISPSSNLPATPRRLPVLLSLACARLADSHKRY